MAMASGVVSHRLMNRYLSRGRLLGAQPRSFLFRRGFCAFPDPYRALGVGRGASDTEIKKAYKEQALKWHPDRNPEGHREEAQKRFSEAASAYEILSDPEKRKEYDTFGRVGGAPEGAGGGPFQGNMHPADAERVFRQMFGQGGMEQIMRQFAQQQQEMRELQQQRLRQQRGLCPEMEVRIRHEQQRILRASRASGIDSEYDERRARYAGKIGTLAKCDKRDQSIKVRIMVSPGRADEVWYGADAVWDPASLQVEMDVRICSDTSLIHEASREVGIGTENDARRERCAGKLGTITDVDPSDGSVKIRVLVGARSADELWFGFGAFEPVPQLPETPFSVHEVAGAGQGSCARKQGGPFPGRPFGGGSPFAGFPGGPFVGGRPRDGGDIFGNRGYYCRSGLPH